MTALAAVMSKPPLRSVRMIMRSWTQSRAKLAEATIRMPPSTIDAIPPARVHPWSEVDDVVEGWDWSLLPEVRPAERSGVSFSGAVPPGFRGHRLVPLPWSWARLEPEEGAYDFESLRGEIEHAGRRADGVVLGVRGAFVRTEIRTAIGDGRHRDRLLHTGQRQCFLQGLPLADQVNPRLAIDLDLFSRGGLTVLELIRLQNYDVIRRRPRVQALARAVLLAGVLSRRLRKSVFPGEARHG